MSAETVLVIGFILAIIGVFFFTKDSPSDETEEEDFSDRLVKTSKGIIKIVKGEVGTNGVGEYFFYLGEFLLTDTLVIGFIWLTIMDDNYVDTEEINLDDFEDSIFSDVVVTENTTETETEEVVEPVVEKVEA
jgi:TM2 domain-containing membrane protein YozV